MKSLEYVEFVDEKRIFNADFHEKSRSSSRVGVEVQFGHPSFIGIDLLKFQIASYSNLDEIDLGVYIVATNHFIKEMPARFGKVNPEIKWKGSLPYEKVIKYLPHVKSAIQVPVFVIGIDI